MHSRPSSLRSHPLLLAPQRLPHLEASHSWRAKQPSRPRPRLVSRAQSMKLSQTSRHTWTCQVRVNGTSSDDGATKRCGLHGTTLLRSPTCMSVHPVLSPGAAAKRVKFLAPSAGAVPSVPTGSGIVASQSVRYNEALALFAQVGRPWRTCQCSAIAIALKVHHTCCCSVVYMSM